MQKQLTNLVKITKVLITVIMLTIFSSKVYANSGLDNNTIEFCNKLQGVWKLVEDTNYNSHFFFRIQNCNQWNYGVYRGEMYRDGQIVKVINNSNGTRTVEVYFPATEANDMYDAQAERRSIMIFSSNDEFKRNLTIEYSDGVKSNYVYVAKNFKNAAGKFDHMDNYPPKVLPTVDVRCTMFDVDMTTLKAKNGSALNGPYDSWRNNTIKIFDLVPSKCNPLDFYMNINSKKELIGTNKNRIEIYGIYNLNGRLREHLPVQVLNSRYTRYVKRYHQSQPANELCIWKIKNGYIVVELSPRSTLPLMESNVQSILFVSKFEYLNIRDWYDCYSR